MHRAAYIVAYSTPRLQEKGISLATIEFQGIVNVRDLGGIPVAGERIVAPGLFYRGGSLAKATEQDLELLFGELGVSCVVDVRCGWELESKPDIILDGIEYLHIPFYDLEKVGIEYTEPTAGTKMVGNDLACEPEHFYRSLANPLTVRQMRACLDAVFDRVCAGRSVYQHCSGGKDRAGILAALILLALGADRDAIVADYTETNISRDKRFDQMMERFLRFTDGDEQHARQLVESHRALPRNLDTFFGEVAVRYGSVDAFMSNQLGLTDERKSMVRTRCTNPLG